MRKQGESNDEVGEEEERIGRESEKWDAREKARQQEREATNDRSLAKKPCPLEPGPTDLVNRLTNQCYHHLITRRKTPLISLIKLLNIYIPNYGRPLFETQIAGCLVGGRSPSVPV